VPPDLPASRRAALFVNGVTGWYVVYRYGRARPRETVLVHGAAGGVGSVCVQLAALAGARVLATASTTERQAVARDLGASVAMAPDPATLAPRLREATEGRGVDVVVGMVGGQLFEPSLAALARRGRYVVVGSATQAPARLDVRRLLPRSQTVAGFIVRDVIETDPNEPEATIERLVDLIRSGALRLRLRSLPLGDAAESHRLVEARAVTGKIVLTP
jgi:NADPH2:quinone reductase